MAQVAPDALGGAIPSNDPYETSFTTGQRNIFVSLVAAHGRFVRQRYANQHLQRLPHGSEHLHCPQPAEARTRASTTARMVWAT
jgi:hypothetical protein